MTCYFEDEEQTWARSGKIFRRTSHSTYHLKVSSLEWKVVSYTHYIRFKVFVGTRRKLEIEPS